MLAALPMLAAVGSEPQVIVMGAHHSGTSIVALGLAKLGLFLGSQEDLLVQSDNRACAPLRPRA